MRPEQYSVLGILTHSHLPCFGVLGFGFFFAEKEVIGAYLGK